MRRTGLSRRSQQSLLPPHMGNVLGWADLLRAEAEEGCWRIVEAYAEKGPIELDVGWSGGDGQGQTARLTVARATRFAVFASSLTLKAANLASVENRVGCHVADGYCTSANQAEVRGTGGEIPQVIPVVPFALSVRLDVGDPAQLAACQLAVVDGVGLVRAALPANLQPATGIPLGAASAIRATVPPNVPYRVIFTLSL